MLTVWYTNVKRSFWCINIFKESFKGFRPFWMFSLTACPLSHGAGLQLGRDEKEQRKHAQIGKQVLGPASTNALARKTNPWQPAFSPELHTQSMLEIRACKAFILKTASLKASSVVHCFFVFVRHFLKVFFQVKVHKKPRRWGIFLYCF